jgi:predicted translin family RNA/ssDNA-binding protein
MANLRTFKKDVIFLVNEVISDCWVFMYLNRDKDVEEANKIVADAVELGDNLFEQINHYPKDDAKKHFKALNQKLLEGVDALFVRLSGLTK